MDRLTAEQVDSYVRHILDHVTRQLTAYGVGATAIGVFVATDVCDCFHVIADTDTAADLEVARLTQAFLSGGERVGGFVGGGGG